MGKTRRQRDGGFGSLLLMESQGGQKNEAGDAHGGIDGGHYFRKPQLAGKEGRNGHKKRERLETGAACGSEAGNKAVKAADGRGIDLGDENEGINQPCCWRDPPAASMGISQAAVSGAPAMIASSMTMAERPSPSAPSRAPFFSAGGAAREPMGARMGVARVKL